MQKAKLYLEKSFLKNLEKIKNQLTYVSEHSEFYKRYFAKHGISTNDIQSYEDYKNIPTIDKAVLQNDFKDFWGADSSKIIDYSNTSGTEGKPITIPLTTNDVERLATNEYLSLAVADGTSSDIYQLTTTIDKRFMAGLAYTLGAHKLSAGMIRTGPGLPELQWQTIFELKTTALIVVPSFLLKLIDFAIENKIDYKNSSINKAICIGEPIRNSDFTLNALGQRINNLWDIKLYSTYASSEIQTAFTECSFGNGGHMIHDLIFAEVLNDKGELVNDGEFGELTITALGVEGFPLVRFRTGDICAMYFDPCKCGNESPRIGPIIGRKHQMIKFKGTTTYPPSIFEVLDRMEEVINYQIIISKNEFNEDDILINYSTNAENIEHKLTSSFRSAVRCTPRLNQLPNDELHSMLFNSFKRKPQKIIDKRPISDFNQ